MRRNRRARRYNISINNYIGRYKYVALLCGMALQSLRMLGEVREVKHRGAWLLCCIEVSVFTMQRQFRAPNFNRFFVQELERRVQRSSVYSGDELRIPKKIRDIVSRPGTPCNVFIAHRGGAYLMQSTQPARAQWERDNKEKRKGKETFWQ